MYIYLIDCRITVLANTESINSLETFSFFGRS